MKLGILGTGNMAEALIAGATSKQQGRAPVLSCKNVIVFDIRPKQLRYIQKTYHVKTARSSIDVIKKSDTLLLAVKPQQIKSLLTDIGPYLSKRHLILSIAAGIDTKFFEKHIGLNKKVVRLMPNTPALIGMGATAFYLNRHCTKQDRKIVENIFGAVGLVVEIKQENKLDAVTGLSGSGPAYVYSFIQSLIRGGQKAGLKESTARQLATQTVIGATNLLNRLQLPAEKLIAQVASKGGTTEAGLKVLKREKFGTIVEGCVKAATGRARKLRKS